jgi:hypothetical protein
LSPQRSRKPREIRPDEKMKPRSKTGIRVLIGPGDGQFVGPDLGILGQAFEPLHPPFEANQIAGEPDGIPSPVADPEEFNHGLRHPDGIGRIQSPGQSRPFRVPIRGQFLVLEGIPILERIRLPGGGEFRRVRLGLKGMEELMEKRLPAHRPPKSTANDCGSLAGRRK